MANVFNHDIAGIVRRLDRFVQELHKSVSSGTSRVNDFDSGRLQTYLDSIRSYKAWIVAQPHLDLPESHPKSYSIPEEQNLAEVENESVNDVIRLMSLSREELINSQSARDAAQLNKFDGQRFDSLVQKMQDFLDNHIKLATPLDMPESSPSRESSGPGLKGI